MEIRRTVSITARDARTARTDRAALLMLASVIIVASCACSGETSRGAAPPASRTPSSSSTPSSNRPAADTPRSNSSSAASDSAPSSGSQQPPTCAPWANAVSLVARSQAGRPDFFRELGYDFKTGAVRVHDSDPFPDGKTPGAPRVIQDAKTLPADTRDRVERALTTTCPTADAMAQRCAPGGCMRLVITHADGKTTTVEDHATVQAIMQQLATQFPQLRAS
jgi:hypothetical protein